MRIIVLGYIVRGPLGGLAWHHMQYVMGLDRLGHDVYFLEDSDDYPSCYDPVRGYTDKDPAYGLRFIARSFDEIGLGERWAYYDNHTTSWFGPASEGILDVCASAEIILNLSGVNPARPWLERIPSRVLVDTDPAFTQIRNLTDPDHRQRTSQHTSFLSFGENIASGAASVPVDGYNWLPTRQPIMLDAWPVTPGPLKGKYTSVMQWDSYPAVEYAGRHYGMKSESFVPFMDLPQDAGIQFELAVGSSTAPREELRRKGWDVRDPLEPTRTPWTYQTYIKRSKAEFGIAKHGYVVTHSGWFSERSANYLASGRPVVVQDTGFTDWLHADMGVKSFKTPDEALAAIDDVNSRYEAHCRAAREVAEAYFDYRKVLPELIESALNGHPPPKGRIAATV